MQRGERLELAPVGGGRRVRRLRGRAIQRARSGWSMLSSMKLSGCSAPGTGCRGERDRSHLGWCRGARASRPTDATSWCQQRSRCQPTASRQGRDPSLGRGLASTGGSEVGPLVVGRRPRFHSRVLGRWLVFLRRRHWPGRRHAVQRLQITERVWQLSGHVPASRPLRRKVDARRAHHRAPWDRSARQTPAPVPRR